MKTTLDPTRVDMHPDPDRHRPIALQLRGENVVERFRDFVGPVSGVVRLSIRGAAQHWLGKCSSRLVKAPAPSVEWSRRSLVIQ